LQVVILERNKLVGRKVARWFVAAGASAVVVEEPAAVSAALAAGADLLCADTFDGDLIAEQTRARPGLRGLLWTAEPLRRSLRYLVETTAIDHVLGRKDFESPPRAAELVMTARRLQGGPAPTINAYLDWGFSGFELEIRGAADRDSAVQKVADFVLALGVPKRIGDMFGELAHELLMNAIYDAPIDAQGRPKYASNRKSDVTLADHERPALRIATDGTRLALQVRDPFGRLERRHVYDGLARGLAGGEQDRSNGGAGLGMMIVHNAATAMIFDVARGKHTEVTALFELDMNLREFRTQAKSLHFWSH